MGVAEKETRARCTCTAQNTLPNPRIYLLPLLPSPLTSSHPHLPAGGTAQAEQVRALVKERYGQLLLIFDYYR